MPHLSAVCKFWHDQAGYEGSLHGLAGTLCRCV